MLPRATSTVVRKSEKSQVTKLPEKCCKNDVNVGFTSEMRFYNGDTLKSGKTTFLLNR